MNDALLVSYLNDHLAGSVIAIEMGKHCRDHHADSDLVRFLDELLAEIEDDRHVLREIIAKLGGEQDPAKKSIAWLSEKVSRLKMTEEAPAERALSRMEQLEVLMLGIRGKLALWQVLQDLSPSDDRLKAFDWPSLMQSAANQVERVDEQRRQAAKSAFLT